jgi:hypothetical protein
VAKPRGKSGALLFLAQMCAVSAFLAIGTLLGIKHTVESEGIEKVISAVATAFLGAVACIFVYFAVGGVLKRRRLYEIDPDFSCWFRSRINGDRLPPRARAGQPSITRPPPTSSAWPQ